MSKNNCKTILLCSLLAANFSSSAQKSLEFGVRYMVTESALMNKADKDAGADLDYANTLSYLSGGVSCNYYFDKHMGLELDILYSRQGQSYTGTNMYANNGKAYSSDVALQAILNDKVIVGKYDAKAELNCIKIPILFTYTTANTKSVYYTISAGPQVNMLQSAVYEINKEDVLLSGTNITPDDVYRKVTMDGVLALGAGFNVSKHFVVTTQLRFDYGFQDVEKKDATFSIVGVGSNNYYGDGRPSTHNATAALMIGLNYKL